MMMPSTPQQRTALQRVGFKSQPDDPDKIEKAERQVEIAGNKSAQDHRSKDQNQLAPEAVGDGPDTDTSARSMSRSTMLPPSGVGWRWAGVGVRVGGLVACDLDWDWDWEWDWGSG